MTPLTRVAFVYNGPEGLELVIGLALVLGMGLVLSFPVFQSVLSGYISSAQHYSYT